MKISELAQRSGVALATVKFYLREGLLPAGEATGPNQAAYGEAHLHRLALIRTLKDVGGLSLNAIREVVRVVETPGISTFDALGAGLDAASPLAEPPDAALVAEVRGYLAGRGWAPRCDSNALSRLATALGALRAVLDPEMPVQALEPYLQAVDGIARLEVEYAAAAMASGATEALTAAIAGTVLYEPILLSLRRLAHEHYTAELLGR